MFIRKLKKIKVFLDGSDNIGWSIDADRGNILSFYDSNLIEMVDDWRKADIIHNLWWNTILDRIPDLREHKGKCKVLVTCSNFIDFELPEFNLRDKFNSVNQVVDGWIAPSQFQKNKLDGIGVNSFYLPFSVNKSIFKPLEGDINIIFDLFGMDRELFRGKVVIGSFQRDSLGSDLSKPKWQKGPAELVELLKGLPKEKYLLLLAGPRRHYLLAECKKYGIPYLYAGNECDHDDLTENAIPIAKMAYLYFLTDVYLITSRSEGGPKAAIEAAVTRTFVLSTRVGLAPDFINEHCIFDSFDLYKNALMDLVANYDNAKDFIERSRADNYDKYIGLLNEEKMKRRLTDIYRQVLKI